MKIIKSLFAHYQNCRLSNTSFIILILYRFYYYVLYGLKISRHQRVTIKGLRNINILNSLKIGINTEGFVSGSDKTYLNIKGELIIKGCWSIGRGCRVYVAPGGIMEIGNGGYVNSFTDFIIGDKLVIGNNCIISWKCQFLNEDNHIIEYKDRKQKTKEIIIGNHVWIGSNVKIHAGTKIPDNCVIASDSVIKTVFNKQNVLIGGNPAKVLKENVTWHV